MAEHFARRSTRARLVANSLGLTLLVSLALTCIAGLCATHYLHDQLRRRLTAVTSMGALVIDADALARLHTRADESGADYQRVVQQLRAIRSANPGVRDVYALRPGESDADWTVAADAGENRDRVVHVGDRRDVSVSPEVWSARDRPTVNGRFVQDRRGIWLSGYAPVRDQRGRLVAILGVDVSAVDVQREETAALQVVLLSEVLLLLVAVAVSERLALSISGPITALAEATEKVAAGDLSARVEARGPAELLSLAASFNAMTETLHAGRARMEELSNTDFLTGLRNHRYFQERLTEEVSRADRYHRPLSLVMLDVDHFRQVNARHGHQGGDDLLEQLGRLLRAAARESDVVTRYGGEEFAIILPETDGHDAVTVAERLRAQVQAEVFTVRSLGEILPARITISGGVATFPTDSGEKDGLVVAADVALYRAKYVSRNRVCRFADDDDFPAVHVDPMAIHRALQDAGGSAVASLAQALDARDHYTRGHSENVTRIALIVGNALGLSGEALTKLRIAGMLHDIGKIGVPDAVLNKQGRLTEEEWAVIRAHPAIGASILSKAPVLEDVIPIVLGHHERFDGSGYPNHIAGEEIPLASRIIAVADAYDAMISDRPYRPAMTCEEALAEVQRNAGTHFDPDVVDAFEHVAAEILARPKPVSTDPTPA